MLDPAAQQQAANCSSQVIDIVTEGEVSGLNARSGGHRGQLTEEEKDQQEITVRARGYQEEGTGMDLC